MLPDNPTLIQAGPNTATPLILLHDGGGTIFNYFMLGDLHRPVYGIHDPKFGTAERWPGGLEEMARLYIALIRSTVPPGPILIGGWSLGGLTALEMARILLADDTASGIHVQGVILIDSPLPEEWVHHRHRFVDIDVPVSETTSSTTKAAVDRRMEECDRLLDGWKAPRWAVTSCRAGPTSIPHHQLAHGQEVRSLRQQPLAPTPPPRGVSSAPLPVVLLRAKDRVPVPADSPPGSLVDVDLHRASPLLGWDALKNPLVQAIYDIPGHHFDLFEGNDRLDNLTRLLARISGEMDRGGGGSK